MLLRQAVAWVCVLLMAALSLASVSQDWHERMHNSSAADTECDHHHGHTHPHPEPLDHSDDGCAICKMAAGQLTQLIDPPRAPVGEPNFRFLPHVKNADVPASPSTSRAQGRAPPRLS